MSIRLQNGELHSAFDLYSEALNHAQPRLKSPEQIEATKGLAEMAIGLKKLIHSGFDIHPEVQAHTNTFFQNLCGNVTFKQIAENTENPFAKVLKTIQLFVLRFLKLPAGSLEVERKI